VKITFSLIFFSLLYWI